MTQFRYFITAAVSSLGMLIPSVAWSADGMVYNVYRPVDLGEEGQAPQKDIYVNLGRNQGIVLGAVLDVFRKQPTYNQIEQKLHRDITIPVAKLKVIHVEDTVAIARVQEILPTTQAPGTSLRTVMVGDLVRTP